MQSAHQVAKCRRSHPLDLAARGLSPPSSALRDSVPKVRRRDGRRSENAQALLERVVLSAATSRATQESGRNLPHRSPDSPRLKETKTPKAAGARSGAPALGL